MQELIVKEKESIRDKIYMIRGKQVMLDSDLAKLYEVETKCKVDSKISTFCLIF